MGTAPDGERRRRQGRQPSVPERRRRSERTCRRRLVRRPTQHSPAGDPEQETPFTDVYYASSDGKGQTFSPNLRISDRSADRSIGVWSNNVGSAGPVGLVSTNRTAYFAWQDTRNGGPVTRAEDVYMASLPLAGTAAEGGGGAAPRWLLVAGGLALGMGLAMALVWVLDRRSRGPGLGRAVPAPA